MYLFQLPLSLALSLTRSLFFLRQEQAGPHNHALEEVADPAGWRTMKSKRRSRSLFQKLQSCWITLAGAQ